MPIEYDRKGYAITEPKLGHKYYQDHPEESILKPLSPLVAAIEQASAGDLLLFMIAQNRLERAKNTA
jgi:hypothetical protein